MSSVVERFLAAQPPELRRDALERTRPDLTEALRAWGADWSALCGELGMRCPPALTFLGDAMAEQYIYFSFARHQYAMYAPPDARAERASLAKLSREFAQLAPYAAMLPIFGEDGDLLLLDAEGAIHALAHDDWESARCIAENVEDLLARATYPRVNL